MSFPVKNFGTLAIHAGQDPTKWSHRAVIPPISMSSTFKQFSPGEHAGYVYSRCGNPTRNCLEKSVASLESAKYALAVSSGVSLTSTITNLLSTGDHIICFYDVHSDINGYFRKCAAKMGIETTFADFGVPSALRDFMKSNTKMIWLETPTNPTMKIVDIEAISNILKDYPGAICVVDNTFMSPYFQSPLKLGADIVTHSLTKYMNGHADVIMGALATNNEELFDKLSDLQNTLGCVPSPFDCFLVNRGLKTLHLRMERHMENALMIAKFLDHPQVERVVYPGLESHPQHKLAKRQCSGFSGMVAFYIKGKHPEARKFIATLKLFTLATSLGSAESLAEIPSSMTHASLPEEERKAIGITDNLIRLSVGLESVADLLEDLDQALGSIVSSKIVILLLL